MEYANSGGQRRIMKVRVKPRQIRWHHQPFIGNNAVRQAANIEIGISRKRHFGFSTGNKELAQTVIVINPVGIDKNLFNTRQLIQRDLTTHIRRNRHFAPAMDAQTLRLQRRLQGPARLLPALAVLTEENHAHRVVLAEINAEGGLCLAPHKGIGHLHQQAASVPGTTIGGNTSAVRHTGQRFNGRL